MPNKENVPPKPEKPLPHECCGSGCVPCIYDYYYDALEQWNEKYAGASSELDEQPEPDKSA